MHNGKSGVLAILCGLFSAGSASALDADTFHPSGSTFDGQGTVNVLHPSIWFPGSMYGGLAFYWADDPVVRLKSDGTEEDVISTILGTQLAAGYNIMGKVRLDLGIPFYPHIGVGEGLTPGGAVGDIHLGGVIPILDQEESPIAVAFTPAFRLPTGNGDLYVGSEGLSFNIGGAAGGLINSVGWAANAGFMLGGKEEVENLEFGSSMNMKGALFVPFGGTFKAGGELESQVTLAGGTAPYNRNPVEGHLFAQFVKDPGLVVTTGLGRGLVAGVGAPDVRIFLAVAYHTLGTPPVRDMDGDEIPDANDRCPSDPEDRDGFEDIDGCPDLDNDADSIADARDQCPLQPEDFDTFKDEDGCPDPDNDGDRILDAEDACPMEAGSMKTSGCPDRDGDLVIDKEDACIDEPGPVETRGCPDRDGDRIPDKRDKCPDEAADPRADPARSDGCPSKVIVTKEKIEILDRIYFEPGRAKIKPQSDPLLAEIAKVLNDNPDILLVEVAGHTDDQGNDDFNMKLSQARAEAVVTWLVTRGQVDPKRLQAKGYGETKPVQPNTTEAGRAANRRVEFVILQQ